MSTRPIYTLWLILALGCLIAFLVLPFGSIANIPDDGETLVAPLRSFDFVGLIIPLGLAVFLAAIGVCSFKNMMFSRSMAVLALMMELVTIGITLYILCDRATVGQLEWSWTPAFLLAAVLFTIFPIAGISSDIKKVRSYNRLR